MNKLVCNYTNNLSTDFSYIIAISTFKVFIFGCQNLNYHKTCKRIEFSKVLEILRKFHWVSLENFLISTTICLWMVAWMADKNCRCQVFLQFQQLHFVIWSLKCLCDILFAQLQIFGLKNQTNTKTFRKIIAHLFCFKKQRPKIFETPLRLYWNFG